MPRRVQHLQRAERVALVERLVDGARRVLRPVRARARAGTGSAAATASAAASPAARGGRRRRCRPPTRARSTVAPLARLSAARPPRCERWPCVIAIRFRSVDAPAERADRLEHEPRVVLEQRVDERQLAAVVDQERVHVPALAVAEAVDAGRELGHDALRRRASRARTGSSTPSQRRLELREVPQEQRCASSCSRPSRCPPACRPRAGSRA